MRVFRVTYKGRNGQIKTVKRWYCELRDHLQTVRRFPAFTDKQQSEAFGRKIERLVSGKISGEPPDVQMSRWLETIPAKTREHLARIGLLDQSRVAAGQPLFAHVEDFQRALSDKGNTVKQTRLTAARVRRVFTGCRFRMWSDISAAQVQSYLASLRGGGMSKQTSNYCLRAVKHFAQWMVQNGRASASPVGYIKCLNIGQDDIRRVRRALEPDQVRRLLEVTRTGESYFSLTGYERSLLYRLAVESGLRASELRSLKVSSFDFQGCTVTLGSSRAKNRQQATLPLRPDTTAEIRECLARKLPDAQAFKLPGKPIDMLRPDLEAAGIDYVDEAGRYADFHSLRHTCGSLLAARGVHPKIAQSIMRHRDINLTMMRYTHTLVGQEAAAVASLPDFSLPSRQSQKAMKTGTDENDLARCLALQSGQHGTTTDFPGRADRVGGNENAVFNAPEGIQTCALRSRHPPLQNPKSLPNKGLTETTENDLARCLALLSGQNPDLATVVRAWPDLPVGVRQQIKEIIETSGPPDGC